MIYRPTYKEVIWISILVGWTILHSAFVTIGAKAGIRSYKGENGVFSDDKFYPFDENSHLSKHYDFNEFHTYVATAWIMFLVYYILIRAVKKYQD